MAKGQKKPKSAKKSKGTKTPKSPAPESAAREGLDHENPEPEGGPGARTRAFLEERFTPLRKKSDPMPAPPDGNGEEGDEDDDAPGPVEAAGW